jgi:hypothetical protein
MDQQLSLLPTQFNLNEAEHRGKQKEIQVLFHLFPKFSQSKHV